MAAQDEDGTMLSTDVAGGFVGVVLGPHARDITRTKTRMST